MTGLLRDDFALTAAAAAKIQLRLLDQAGDKFLFGIDWLLVFPSRRHGD
jgi:hypothetical protein